MSVGWNLSNHLYIYLYIYIYIYVYVNHTYKWKFEDMAHMIIFPGKCMVPVPVARDRAAVFDVYRIRSN